jgi:segregation and condensation protein B
MSDDIEIAPADPTGAPSENSDDPSSEAVGSSLAPRSQDAKAPAKLDDRIVAGVEAILFACDSPLTAGKIALVAELPTARLVKEAVEALNARYEQVGSAFRIEHIAGGYQMLTQGHFGDMLARLSHQRNDSRLSQASLETLAIVAYRQPVLRADIEAIRGVACGEVLRGLMEKQLIRIAGRAEVLGRPLLYGTTKRFLEVFGLADLSDLPKVEELRGGATAIRPVTTTLEATPPTAEATASRETAAATVPASEALPADGVTENE